MNSAARTELEALCKQAQREMAAIAARPVSDPNAPDGYVTQGYRRDVALEMLGVLDRLAERVGARFGPAAEEWVRQDFALAIAELERMAAGEELH